jgi:glycosyltransferase involved in cell wall biosynthesis
MFSQAHPHESYHEGFVPAVVNTRRKILSVARLAWFSPMPPVPTGPAIDSATVIAALRDEHQIDVYVDEPVVSLAPGTRSAHDFVWRHHLEPYDLTIYQLGNSSHHDYEWPYLFRYPGLTVLHDAHLHHARAAALLRTSRAADYRTELASNHPDAARDVAELAVKGFDNHLHYFWPMTRLVARASRLVAVHARSLAERLREESPDARIETIHLGHGRAVSAQEHDRLRSKARVHYRIPSDAMVFGCYGGLSPDKRLPQILAAFAATRAFVPSAHLLLAGSTARHYDLVGDIARHGVGEWTTVTGYLPNEDDLTACIAAADVALNLRWPTAREISGPWLRALAMAKPTIIIDLAHLTDVPTIDPRTWQANVTRDSDETASPCAIALDILDEDHSLRLAMRRLGTDAALRASIGEAGQRYWTTHHAVELMVEDYRALITRAIESNVPRPPLPMHLVDDGSHALERLIEPFGIRPPLGL